MKDAGWKPSEILRVHFPDRKVNTIVSVYSAARRAKIEAMQQRGVPVTEMSDQVKRTDTIRDTERILMIISKDEHNAGLFLTKELFKLLAISTWFMLKKTGKYDDNGRRKPGVTFRECVELYNEQSNEQDSQFRIPYIPANISDFSTDPDVESDVGLKCHICPRTVCATKTSFKDHMFYHTAKIEFTGEK